MTDFIFSTLLALWLIVFSSWASALSPITVKGTKLYDEDGNQFYVKGVAYSRLDRVDPLLDTDQCEIDAGLIKSLGANTVRVYSVDNTKSHDGCMRAFASQGIYVWLDLPTPMSSMNRVSSPPFTKAVASSLTATLKTEPDWTMKLYKHWTATVDSFAGYDNTLFFTVGNEVINEENAPRAAPYIKAAARDIKAFRDARGYRPIPISYSASDMAFYRSITADYLACGDSEDGIDLYGMNIYSWCGNSSYYASGYDNLYEEFQGYNIPVVFSETGCQADAGGRDFAEVATMLGPVFQAKFSGAVVYEWALQANKYGIVKYSNGQFTGFPSTLAEYNALASVFSTANPTGTAMSAYTPSNSPPSCPTSDSSSGWLVDADGALPTIAGLQIDTVTARTTITSRTASDQEAVATATNAADDGEQATESGGLSTGALVGIVVGCVVVVLSIVAVAAFVFSRKRKSRNQAADQIAGGEDNGPQEFSKAELSGQSAVPVVPKQEMDASQQPRGPAHDTHEYYASNKTISDDVSSGTEPSASANGGQRVAYEMEGSTPLASELPAHHK